MKLVSTKVVEPLPAYPWLAVNVAPLLVADTRSTRSTRADCVFSHATSQYRSRVENRPLAFSALMKVSTTVCLGALTLPPAATTAAIQAVVAESKPDT